MPRPRIPCETVLRKYKKCKSLSKSRSRKSRSRKSLSRKSRSRKSRSRKSRSRKSRSRKSLSRKSRSRKSRSRKSRSRKSRSRKSRSRKSRSRKSKSRSPKRHYSLKGLNDWHDHEFRHLGWMVLSKHNRIPDKVKAYKNSVNRLVKAIEQEMKEFKSGDKHHDLKILLANTKVLQKQAQKL